MDNPGHQALPRSCLPLQQEGGDKGAAEMMRTSVPQAPGDTAPDLRRAATGGVATGQRRLADGGGAPL